MRTGIGERRLSLRGRRERARRGREGDEERVALRVHLDAAVLRERRRAARDGARPAQPRTPPRRAPASSRVDPSMSVKRNVTVPLGSVRTRPVWNVDPALVQ